ncbi:MAG: L-seryl-tRNA(Sec) selenium transferase [Rhodospirillaceae bacterium]|nr:L-seryl-tRNA(Sec) selenium transferase [Rhodospirillaceae bacterium]
MTSLPSLDTLLRADPLVPILEKYGRQAATDSLRKVLGSFRELPDTIPETSSAIAETIAQHAINLLKRQERGVLQAVFNLTGTVLHTNLGRALLPESAIEAVTLVAGSTSSLEYDLSTGRRGDRERGLVERIIRLTGAEDATIVNNNAAAVLLCLNTLAKRREVPVSRGELVEIGGAFRIPDIMKSAGCRIREVGTTNRTHLQDYEEAIGPRTALLLKVHTSNYVVQGFTATVDESELAKLGRAHEVPLMTDLGSGALVNLESFGLPHEPTPMEVLRAGADLVTFSGDKLLGGPQAGLILGRRNLISKLKRNPLKRALRLDKMTLAAFDAVLKLYEDPDRLVERVPTLRHLTRSTNQIRAQADRLGPAIATALKKDWSVRVEPCQSEVGSGSLPEAKLSSYALAIRPIERRRGAVKHLADQMRALPVPILGRAHDRALLLDLRCLDDETGLTEQIQQLEDAT